MRRVEKGNLLPEEVLEGSAGKGSWLTIIWTRDGSPKLHIIDDLNSIISRNNVDERMIKYNWLYKDIIFLISYFCKHHILKIKLFFFVISKYLNFNSSSNDFVLFNPFSLSMTNLIKINYDPTPLIDLNSCLKILNRFRLFS